MGLLNIVRVFLVVLLTLGGSAARLSLDEEDATFWGRALEASSFCMSIPTDPQCVDDFGAIVSLVETSKDSVGAVPIRLCEGSKINFNKAIDMTGAKFAMICEDESCRLDGQGKTRLFEAGNFDGPFSTHDVSFDTVAFFNGNTTVSKIVSSRQRS